MTSIKNENSGEVVRTYYDVLKAGATSYEDGRRLRPILATKLVFEGPIVGHEEGAERFIKGVFGFIQTVQRIDMLHRLDAGNLAATLYDAEMPGGIVRFAEFFTIEEGKIQAIRLMYDPALYLSRGGR